MNHTPQRPNLLFLCADHRRADTLGAALPLHTPATVQARLAEYYGMIRPLDSEVGRILQTLKEKPMVRTSKWKLIAYPHLGKTQLFDMEADPHELTDLRLMWRYEKTA